MERDELSQVAAIWILASNDERPIITFKGIKDRIGLSSDEEVRNLVIKYRELFRIGVRETWLEELKDGWKAQTKDELLPSWLRGKTSDQKLQLINEVTTSNVFRSQLRTSKDATRSSQETIDWGLRHLDLLRKSENELKEHRFKTYQLLLTAFSIAVTLVTVITSYQTARENARLQRELKYFETTLSPKKENYTQFMGSMYDAYEAAIVKDGEQMLSKQKEMQRSYSMLEVFLDTLVLPNDAAALSQFSQLCDTVYKSQNSDGYNNQFVKLKLYFRNRLYSQLFGNSSGSSLAH